VAGDFAFFGPLFLPIFHAELNGDHRLSFSLVERVRQRFCVDASLSATVNACVAAAPMPTILIEAGLEYKKAERERIAAGERGIMPSLRVLKSISNDAAREAHLHIPRPMRVPLTSVIALAHNEDIESVLDRSTAMENLVDWTTSDGGRLPAVDVVIEARKTGDRVLALLTVV
jgi:hypothetical protein